MSQLLKPSFLQLPINVVTDRVSNGGTSIDELCKLFLGRAELEEKSMIFSLKASHINIHQHEIPHSTSAHAFGLLKNYYVYSSRDQAIFHESLNHQVVRSLEDTKNQSIATIEYQKNSIRNANKQSSSTYELLEKAKSNFKKAEADLSSAADKLDTLVSAAEGFERLHDKKKDGFWKDKETQDRDRQKKRVERRVASLAQCTEDIAVRKTLLLEALHERDRVIAEAMVSLQESEIKRLDGMKRCVRAFCDLENTALQQRLKLLSDLDSAVGAMSSDSDLTLFIQAEKTSDITHRYCKALALLDSDYHARVKKTAKIKTPSNRSSHDVTPTENENSGDPSVPNIQIQQNGDNFKSLLLSQLQSDFSSRNGSSNTVADTQKKLSPGFTPPNEGSEAIDKNMRKNDFFSDNISSKIQEDYTQLRNQAEIRNNENRILPGNSFSESKLKIDLVIDIPQKSNSPYFSPSFSPSLPPPQRALSSSALTMKICRIKSLNNGFSGILGPVSTTLPRPHYAGNKTVEEESSKGLESSWETALAAAEAAPTPHNTTHKSSRSRSTIDLNKSSSSSSSSSSMLTVDTECDGKNNIPSTNKSESHPHPNSCPPSGPPSTGDSPYKKEESPSGSRFKSNSDENFPIFSDSFVEKRITKILSAVFLPQANVKIQDPNFGSRRGSGLGPENEHIYYSSEGFSSGSETFNFNITDIGIKQNYGNDISDRNSTVFAVRKCEEFESELMELFDTKEARSLLLQQLDARRCSTGRLSEKGFALMTVIMKIFLDSCSIPDDVQSAMRIVNMANTFHLHSQSKASPKGSEGNLKLENDDVIDRAFCVTYLCSTNELRNHPIWQTEGVWEAALSGGAEFKESELSEEQEHELLKTLSENHEINTIIPI